MSFSQVMRHDFPEEVPRPGRLAALRERIRHIEQPASHGVLPFVAGRRLQLAAERSGITAFLLRRWRNSEEAARERERPSAAVTRWRIAALPAREVDDLRLRQLIGQPRWRVELLRCRGGVPAQWVVESGVVESGDVEVADATGHVRLSPELADRPAAAVDRKEGRLAAEPLQRRHSFPTRRSTATGRSSSPT